MLMACDLDTLSDHRIINKLIVLGSPSEKDLLYHMVTIDVFSEFLDYFLQVGCKEFNLKRGFYYLDNLLN